jgi:two-component system nitrogen regulation response regulator GlnG
MLTRFFLGKSARELGVDAKRITDVSLEKLQTFDFPGNVRQLENICHWLTVMAPAQVIEAKDLPPELLEASAVPAPLSTPAPQPGAAAFAAAPTAAAAPASPAAAGPVPAFIPSAPVSPPVSAPSAPAHWLVDLERESRAMLEAGAPEVWDTLTRRFEAQLIHTALEITRGRRIEAAQRLGIGRNTITRKIQELGLDD